MIPYKNDGQCWLWLPSNLTLSTLSAEAAAMLNAVHTNIGLPTGFVEGAANPYIMTLNDLDMGGAPFYRNFAGDWALCGPIENKQFLTVQQVQLIVAFTGDIESYLMWFEVDDLDELIPGDNPRFEGMTWADLAKPFPVDVEWQKGENGKWYRTTEIHQTPNDGQPLAASEWVALMRLGVSVVDKKTRDIQFPIQSPI